MPFQKGHTFSKGNGRPKGSKTRIVQLADDLVTKLDVDPLEVLMLFAKGDWEALGYDSKETICYNSAGQEYSKLTVTPEMRVSAAREAVKYIYCQRKAVELSNQGESEGFRIIVEDYTKK
jgi:hypothetical protein